MAKKYAKLTKTIVTKVGNLIYKELEEAKRFIQSQKAENNAFIEAMLNISTEQIVEIRKFLKTDPSTVIPEEQILVNKYYALPEV
jgi:uncharacterized protein (UPF0305 family)